MKLRMNKIKLENWRKNGWKWFKIWNKQIHVQFLEFETIRSFADNIFDDRNTASETDKKQHNLLENFLELKMRPRGRAKEDKKKQINTFKCKCSL